jgi:hypothetical protein
VVQSRAQAWGAKTPRRQIHHVGQVERDNFQKSFF